jgi:Tol biopolymer transport system component
VIFTATTELAASVYKDIAANIYSISLNGGNAVQVSKDGFNYSTVEMSSNGKYLYCLAAAAGDYKVYNLSKLGSV